MYAVVEIGGTNTRVAVTDNLVEIGAVKKFISDHDLNGQKKVLHDTLTELLTGGKVDAIVVGVPGVVNKSARVIVQAPNYPSLNGITVVDLLSGLCPPEKIFLENDAALGAVGEVVMGAGKQYTNAVYISLGTGVGMVRVLNKKLDPNQTSYEFGHHIINWNAYEKDKYGYKGSFESYASGAGFRTTYKMDPLICSDAGTWVEYGKMLAIGIVNVSLAWNPEAVIFGGGISARFDMFYPGIEYVLNDYNALPLPAVIKSTFGDGSGIIGGFEMLKQAL